MDSQERVVDKMPSPERHESVDVIVLGLSRTGTMSMFNALNKLGYKTYHMSEACLNTSKGHLTMWNEAIEAKYGPSLGIQANASSRPSPYTSLDFRKLLQGYSAVTDAPTVLFAEELLAAYPRARLVLTTHPRGVDGWLRSMQNSYFRVTSWSIWPLLMKHDNVFSLPYMTLIRRIMEVWTGTPWLAAKSFTPVQANLRSFYMDHNQKMCTLAKAQGRELLEFHPSKGWEPLCEFLGKEIPSEPYPHHNEGNHVVNLHKLVVLMRLKATYGRSVLAATVSIAAAGLAWWLLGMKVSY